MASKEKRKAEFGVYLAKVKQKTAAYSHLPPETKEVLDHYQHNISVTRCAAAIIQCGAFAHRVRMI